MDKLDLAACSYQKALALVPDSFATLTALARLKLRQERGKEAVALLQRVLRIRPKDSTVLTNLGLAHAQAGQTAKAVENLQAALKVENDSLPAMNNLAWILATHPESKFRDAKQAIVLAERMCEATEYRISQYLDTLSAALANAGKYDEAVEMMARAIALAEAGGNQGLRSEMADRLRLYRNGRPYRDRR